MIDRPIGVGFDALTDAQFEQIHLATLEILERTGCEVQGDRALRLLREAGCFVDGRRVRIPAALVRWALSVAPEKVTLCTRDGERVMPLEGNRVFFGTGSDLPKHLDPDTGRRRPATADDMATIARLADALPRLDFNMSMGIPSDRPRLDNYLHGFAILVANSRKPFIFTAQDWRDMEAIYEMAVAVVGSPERLAQAPFCGLYAEPVSPLVHTEMGAEKLVFCAEHGIPCAYVSGIMAGANAPITVAGAVALANAECLSGLVIAQLAQQGAPCIYGANVSVMDMRTAVYSYGCPEFSLTNAVFASMAHRYRLPVWGLAGAPDAKVVDAQAGAEAAVSILTAALAGGNLVHDCGYLESGLTSSLEMMVLADELIGMARTIARGLVVNADELALDVIDRVGPGGNFLGDDHTVARCRSAHFIPAVLDRNNFEAWSAAGAPDLYTRLNRRAKELLAAHTVPPLPPDVQAQIDDVLARRARGV
jgi:trimethylamine--corrinoid protein Co-methyltransferase